LYGVRCGLVGRLSDAADVGGPAVEFHCGERGISVRLGADYGGDICSRRAAVLNVNQGESCSLPPLQGDSRGMTTAPQMEFLDTLGRDCVGLIHGEHFRRLQHKTLFLVVTEGDLNSTRLPRPSASRARRP